MKVNIGDIFVNKWGYGQTNVDFYQVVDLSKSGKTAYLRKLSQYSTDENGKPQKRNYSNGSGYTMPKKNRFVDFTDETPDLKSKMLKRRVMVHSKDRPYFYMNSARSMVSGQIAWPWDGKPVRESWYH